VKAAAGLWESDESSRRFSLQERTLVSLARFIFNTATMKRLLWVAVLCALFTTIVAEETAKDAHTCNVQICHDAEHPSAIQLPLR
jgi:hypothetical protein